MHEFYCCTGHRSHIYIFTYTQYSLASVDGVQGRRRRKKITRIKTIADEWAHRLRLFFGANIEIPTCAKNTTWNHIICVHIDRYIYFHTLAEKYYCTITFCRIKFHKQPMRLSFKPKQVNDNFTETYVCCMCAIVYNSMKYEGIDVAKISTCQKNQIACELCRPAVFTELSVWR